MIPILLFFFDLVSREVRVFSFSVASVTTGTSFVSCSVVASFFFLKVLKRKKFKKVVFNFFKKPNTKQKRKQDGMCIENLFSCFVFSWEVAQNQHFLNCLDRFSYDWSSRIEIGFFFGCCFFWFLDAVDEDRTYTIFYNNAITNKIHESNQNTKSKTCPSIFDGHF